MAQPMPPDETRVAKDTVIFRQGDSGSEMFVIAAGHVRLTLGSEGYETHIGTLGPGEFFGELSLLTGAPRTATAKAAEDTLLLAINRDVFATMMHDDLDLVLNMLRIIGERLSVANRPRQRQAQRLGQIRIVTEGLRHLITQQGQLPYTFDVGKLAGALEMNAEAVRNTVAELASSGAGTLEGAAWRFERWEQVEKAVEGLARYAESGSD